MIPGRVVGVDVGGTKVAVGWIEDDAFHTGAEEPTDKGRGADGLLDQLARMIEEARGAGAAGVGLGVPSAIEWATGRVKSSVNIPLRDVHLRHVLQERVGLPVFVDNDANVAALAEAHDGDRFTVRDLVMLTVGTGVGGGLVLNGRIYRGATGAGAELGHVLVGLDLEDGAPAPAGRFPQPGSLESLAAGTALDRLAARHGMRDGRDVVARAEEGDARARDLLRVLGERLGIGVASMANTFDPQEIVIGGGAARAGELLLAPVAETARKWILPGVGDVLQIRLARHGGEAGVRGAALLAALELEP